MDGRRVRLWRWVLLTGVSVAAAGAGWFAVYRLEPAFGAVVPWTLATGPGTPVAGAEAFRRILVQSGALADASGVAHLVPRDAAGSRGFAGKLDVTVGRSGDDVVTVWLRVYEPTPWRAVRVARAVARSLEEWDRRAAAGVVESLMIEVHEAIGFLTEEIRTRQVLGAPSALAVLQADLAEMAAFRDDLGQLLARAEDGDLDGLLRRSGGVLVSLAPGASPLATIVAFLATAVVAVLVVLSVRGFLMTGRLLPRFLWPRQRVLATVPLNEPDHAMAVRSASGALADAVLERFAGPSPTVIVVTGPTASAGKARVACLLAEELARRTIRTLLVDTVLHAPAIADRYRRRLGSSFDEALSQVPSTLEWFERPSSEHRVITVKVDGIAFDMIAQRQPIWLAPGTAGSLFGAVEQVVDRWARYHIAVVDAPALAADRGTDWLASCAAGIVLVVDGHSSGQAVAPVEAAARRRFGHRVLGVVVLSSEDARSDAPETDG